MRRNVEASREDSQGDAADMANIDLSLQAQMATAYFQLRGADSLIQLLDSTVKDLESQLDLTQRRLKGGVATEVDVAQAQTQLETVRAQRVDVEQARAEYEHAVGTIADYKLSNFSIPFSPLNSSCPRFRVGVPSQLLERRPDIAAAERRTRRRMRRSGSRSARTIPTISLSGTGGFESTHGGHMDSGAECACGAWERGDGTAVRRRAAACVDRPGAAQLRGAGLGLQGRSYFWRSRMSRISFRHCVCLSGKRLSSKRRWLRRSTRSIFQIALQGRSDELSGSADGRNRRCCRTSRRRWVLQTRQFMASVALIAVAGRRMGCDAAAELKAGNKGPKLLSSAQRLEFPALRWRPSTPNAYVLECCRGRALLTMARVASSRDDGFAGASCRSADVWVVSKDDSSVAVLRHCVGVLRGLLCRDDLRVPLRVTQHPARTPQLLQLPRPS